MGKKIFIVEDDVILLSSLQAKFSVEGFNVLVHNGAGDINEIIKLIKISMPDLIILDLILPKVDGFELLGSIKAADSISGIPIFVFSNLSDDDSKKKCFSLGAEQYFVKSDFNLDQFIEKIKKIIFNKIK
ncbi:MAG TPA: response regulator [bacterium]|nr:response regulator [bacterium]